MRRPDLQMSAFLVMSGSCLSVLMTVIFLHSVAKRCGLPVLPGRHHALCTICQSLSFSNDIRSITAAVQSGGRLPAFLMNLFSFSAHAALLLENDDGASRFICNVGKLLQHYKIAILILTKFRGPETGNFLGN